MRQMIGKAVVDAPADVYRNVNVELVSDDDVTMTATVANRQGVVLVVFRGPWTYADAAWVVDTVDGQVVIFVDPGCGCGGTLVEVKLPAGAAPGQGYLP